MEEHPTNFYLLKMDVIREYGKWRQKNPSVNDPVESENFTNSILGIFRTHDFFSPRIYHMYKEKVREIMDTDRYTEEHHKMIAIELMKDWLNEFNQTEKATNEFFKKF